MVGRHSQMFAGMPEVDHLDFGLKAFEEGPVVGGTVGDGDDPDVGAHPPDMRDLACELRLQRELAAFEHAAEIEGVQALSGAGGASPVPLDESLDLVDDYLTRPAAELGLLMMGHCTAREAAAFFAKTGTMAPSVSTLQHLTLTMHACWESLGPETLDGIREAEGIAQDAVCAAVSLDGVMVALRAGEDGRAEASWRETACGTVSFHDAEGAVACPPVGGMFWNDWGVAGDGGCRDVDMCRPSQILG